MIRLLAAVFSMSWGLDAQWVAQGSISNLPLLVELGARKDRFHQSMMERGTYKTFIVLSSSTENPWFGTRHRHHFRDAHRIMSVNSSKARGLAVPLAPLLRLESRLTSSTSAALGTTRRRAYYPSTQRSQQGAVPHQARSFYSNQIRSTMNHRPCHWHQRGPEASVHVAASTDSLPAG